MAVTPLAVNPPQTLPALPAIVGGGGATSANLPSQRVSLDTSSYVGKKARIFLRVQERAAQTAKAIISVDWHARRFHTALAVRPDARTLIFEGVVNDPALVDVFDIRVVYSTRPLLTVPTLEPIFEIEHHEGANGLIVDTLPATTPAGGPLEWAVPIVRPVQDTRPRKTSLNQQAEQAPISVQPAGRGVRIERRTAGQRIAFVPEASDNEGAVIGGAFASALFGGAIGVLGSVGSRRDELIVNSAWNLGRGRLLITGGQLRQDMDFGFDSGSSRYRVALRGGGLGYEAAFGGAWSPRVAAQGYQYDTASRSFGEAQFSIDGALTAQFFSASRRIAGSRIRGLQSHTSIGPLPGSTVTLALGGERLSMDLEMGRESRTEVTGGVTWLQQLPSRFLFQANLDQYSSQSVRGLKIGRSFAGRHQLDVDLTSVQGRNGGVDDTRLRVGYSVSFGSSSSAPQTAGIAETASDPLLDAISNRPSFMPFMPVARVDTTVAKQRSVIIQKGDLPPGAQINLTTADITVPIAVKEIAAVTRNGQSFANTGQFSSTNNSVVIHPKQMTQPAAGSTDWYVVTVRNPSQQFTDVTIEVKQGSVEIASVRVGEPRDEIASVPVDTTPDAFSFTAQTGVAVSTVAVSNTITVAGINAAAAISVTGGEYSVNGGGYTAGAGTVTNGQTVTVRQTSSASYSTLTTAAVTIGGVAGAFDATTMAAPVDTTPDAFSFTAQTGVGVSTVAISNTITVAGINAAAAISVTGGEYSVNGGGYTAGAGTVTNGQTVTVRQTSSTSFATLTTATVTVGGVAGAFDVTTAGAPVDTTPDAFSFTAQTGVGVSTVAVSNTITVAGINAAAAISVTGGEYSVNGGAYTAGAGTVQNGQTVTVRQTSSASYSTPTTATVTIGGVAGAFDVTTAGAPVDTTPDAFSFTAQTGVGVSTVAVSNTITVAGINAAAAISVTGGEYSVNGGAYTAGAGTVTNGQTITARQTSSASFATLTTATVTIGGVAGAFDVTTAGAPVDTTPDAFSFTAQTGVGVSTVAVSNTITVAGINAAAAISVTGGEYSVNGGAYTAGAGTVTNGQTITVRQTSSASYSTLTTAAVTIGGVAGAFDVTTAGAPVDTTPDAFSFTAQTGVGVSTVAVSNTITVAGINAAAAISVTGGEYSVNGGAYTAGAGTVTNGQTITVRQTSSASYSTLTTAAVTIGGVAGAFDVTTLAAPVDTTPDAFSFTAQTGVAVSTVAVSNTITVAGINAAAAISVTGGEYSVNGGAYTAGARTVTNGQTVTVRQTSSASYSTPTTATVTIGGVPEAFTVTTLAAPVDTTPDAFSFTAQTGVARSTVITSNAITVSGINAAAAISVTGGEYSVNGGAYTAGAATVTNGQTVTVRQTSSASYSTPTTATVTIGGVAGAFTVTTLAAPVDTTPDAFSFTAQTGVARSTVITSNAITVSGINAAAAISVTGGEYSVNGGGYTVGAGTVTNGQTVTVRQTSSASYSTPTTATVTIGGVAGAFTVTTLAAPVDTTPDAFSFTAQTGVARSTVITSNAITVSGINAAAAISVTGGEYSVNGGAYTAGAATVTNGQTVTVRQTSSASYSTPTTATVTIGGVAGAFTVTTLAAPVDTTPDAFSFTAQTGVARGTDITSNAITVSGINAAAAISISAVPSANAVYSVNGGAYTSVAGTVTNGNTVSVRLRSRGGPNQTQTATLTIGGVSAVFSVTTN